MDEKTTTSATHDGATLTFVGPDGVMLRCSALNYGPDREARIVEIDYRPSLCGLSKPVQILTVRYSDGRSCYSGSIPVCEVVT